MIKKLMVILNVCLMIFLVACSNADEGTKDEEIKDEGSKDEESNNDGDVNNDMNLNLGGDEFIIMVNNKDTADPRSVKYKGLYKQEKTTNIQNVEANYNCKVVYKNYPANAPWGSDRTIYIIEQSKQQKPSAHIYETSATDLGKLSLNNAILPLTDYIEDFGVEGYWETQKKLGTVKDKIYSYGDTHLKAEEGLYFNINLYKSVMGKDATLPDKMWLDGEWTWEKYKEVTKKLNANLNENAENPQYVIGGRTYYHAFQMLGANGQEIVSNNYKINILNEESMDTINFIAELYKEQGMWNDDAPIVEPEFVSGNIVFHNGENWWVQNASRFGNAKFDIGFVPYPVGPSIEDEYVKEDLSNFKTNLVHGAGCYAISSGFKKENIQEGYYDQYLHEESIFRIWAELLHFEEQDKNTLEPKFTEQISDYYLNRIEPAYDSKDSVEAHLNVINTANQDMFYCVEESDDLTEGGYIMLLEEGIRHDNVRNALTTIVGLLKDNLRRTYSLGDDFDFGTN